MVAEAEGVAKGIQRASAQRGGRIRGLRRVRAAVIRQKGASPAWTQRGLEPTSPIASAIAHHFVDIPQDARGTLPRHVQEAVRGVEAWGTRDRGSAPLSSCFGTNVFTGARSSGLSEPHYRSRPM